MKRQLPIQIELKKDGKHWAVHAENQLVAIVVYRKGALTVEALLRGLIHYTSRKRFRMALKEALTAKEPVITEKPAKDSEASQKPEKKPAAKKKSAKQKSGKQTLAVDGEPKDTPAESSPSSAVELVLDQQEPTDAISTPSAESTANV